METVLLSTHNICFDYEMRKLIWYLNHLRSALLNLADHFSGRSFSWRPSGLITYYLGKYIELRIFSQSLKTYGMGDQKNRGSAVAQW